MENWKPLNNSFGHIYEISDKGNLRKRKNKYVCKRHIRNGYVAVNLYDPITKMKRTKNLHRLVAMTFLKKTDRFVNHKNGIKTDNTVENLEWVSAKQNCQHALQMKLAKPKGRGVRQLSKTGEVIACYNSILEASRKTGANDRHISAVCKGKRKTTGGFRWEYIIPDSDDVDCDGVEINGYSNYLITKDGNVFSKKSKKNLSPKILPSGYKCVTLCLNGIPKDFYIKKLIREHYPSDTLVPN